MPNVLKLHLEATRSLLNPETQRVVCAAIQHSSGEVLTSIRHYDALMRMTIEARQDQAIWSDHENITQGFVDQWGNFLTRKEAMVVAIRQNQIIRPEGSHSDELYSECLY